jgi:small subunit ribosomal protein S7
MSRKKHRIIRPVEPDVRYGNETVSRFINVIMRRGKKALAQRIFYDAMDIVEKKKDTDAEPVEIFLRALDNLRPMVEVKSRRVGGANYQVPIEVSSSRRQALAFRWLSGFAHKRSEYRAADRLANEILDAAKRSGNAMRKRDEVHRMAEANRAFAHYRY